MTNVSRRSIAKGAAWSVPAVVVGAPAAVAATSFAEVACPVGAALSDTGVKSYTSTIGTMDPYDRASAGLAGKGTYYSFSAGMWQFAKPAGYVTGYKLSMPNPTQVGLTTFSGVKSYGTYNSGMITTPQVIGAGLAMAFNMQTPIPYTGSGSTEANWLQGASIPFCITYLAGLTPTDTSVTLNTCCYYINYTFNQPVVGSAGVANAGNAYTVTTKPVYGPAGTA